MTIHTMFAFARDGKVIAQITGSTALCLACLTDWNRNLLEPWTIGLHGNDDDFSPLDNARRNMLLEEGNGPSSVVLPERNIARGDFYTEDVKEPAPYPGWCGRHDIQD